MESAGCRRHILLSETAVIGTASDSMTGRGNHSSTDMPLLSHNKSLEVDLMATGERQGVRKPGFGSHIQAIFSNPYLPVMMIIYLLMYN